MHIRASARHKRRHIENRNLASVDRRVRHRQEYACRIRAERGETYFSVSATSAKTFCNLLCEFVGGTLGRVLRNLFEIFGHIVKHVGSGRKPCGEFSASSVHDARVRSAVISFRKSVDFCGYGRWNTQRANHADGAHRERLPPCARIRFGKPLYALYCDDCKSGRPLCERRKSDRRRCERDRRTEIGHIPPCNAHTRAEQYADEKRGLRFETNRAKQHAERQHCAVCVKAVTANARQRVTRDCESYAAANEFVNGCLVQNRAHEHRIRANAKAKRHHYGKQRRQSES